MSKVISLENLTRFWTNVKSYVDTALNGKVSTVSGKGLSTNDLTNTLKGNYDAAYTHSQDGTVHVTAAQKTAWDGKANADHTHTEYASSTHSHSYNDLTGKPTIPTTVAQLTDAGNYALKTDIANVYKYKGTKTAYSELPTTGNTTGDVWDVSETGMNYAWNGTAWDALGTSITVDTATNAEIDALFD